MYTRLIAALVKYLLRGILKTCRVQIEGIEYLKEAAHEGPLILMLWHNRLAPLAEILRPLGKIFTFSAFVSKSKDGEILSQLVLTYKGGKVIRVPHNHREGALRTMIETLQKKEAVVMITPDGPRGPRYKLKPGVRFAATETNARIIAFNWEAKKYYELNTWDKFRIPLPFTTVKATFSEPIESDASVETLESVLNNG